MRISRLLLHIWVSVLFLLLIRAGYIIRGLTKPTNVTHCRVSVEIGAATEDPRPVSRQ